MKIENSVSPGMIAFCVGMGIPVGLTIATFLKIRGGDYNRLILQKKRREVAIIGGGGGVLGSTVGVITACALKKIEGGHPTSSEMASGAKIGLVLGLVPLSLWAWNELGKGEDG